MISASRTPESGCGFGEREIGDDNNDHNDGSDDDDDLLENTISLAGGTAELMAGMYAEHHDTSSSIADVSALMNDTNDSSLGFSRSIGRSGVNNDDDDNNDGKPKGRDKMNDSMSFTSGGTDSSMGESSSTGSGWGGRK